MAERTSDLILAAESSLAFLAQLHEEEEQHVQNEDVDMSSYQPVEPRKEPASNRAARIAAMLDDLDASAAVEKSVKKGLAHVKVQFPDRSVEYVDVNASTTTIGDVLGLAWSKRHGSKEKPKLLGLFQGQEVPTDWLLLDCGLTMQGTLQLQLPMSQSNMRTHDNASISSIFNAYSTQNDYDMNWNASSSFSLKSAEWMERQVRPEEAAFAKALDQLFTKLDMVDDSNMLCQQVLMEYVDILQTQIEKLEKTGTANVSSSAIPYQINNGFTFQNRNDQVSQSVRISDELKNERNTWRLLFELRELSIQKKDDLSILSTTQLPVTSQSTEMDAIAALENRHQIFALQKTILKWLEHVATENVVATKEKRQMHLRTLKQLKRKTSGQCFAMDPDGPLREGDNYLDDDDVEDELDLLKSVWHLLRAGKTHEAIDLCIQLGQPWRAASLSGGEISGACDNETGISRWGNPYRMLWKKMCWQFAQSPAPSNLHNTNSLEAREFDSIIYAALCGHAQVILESPHCNSWEDHCWALIKAVIAFQEDDAIFHLLNLKAQTTSLILENSPDHMQLYKAFLAQLRPVVGRFCTNIDQLFEELAASTNEVVRAQAQHPHRRIQAKLVTSRIDNIVQDILAALLGPLNGPFSWDLELNDNIPADSVSPQLLRFGAHFVLFMKTTGESYDEEAGARLLKAYIRHLVKHAQYKLVALYAGQLPEEGRGEIYAQCLITIPRHEERQQCLAAIAPFCPPVLFAQVTRAAAETLMASKTDARRIGALSLLTFDEKHRVEALYQANVLARQFIAEDKQVSLKALFAQLPEDSLSVINQQSIKEDKLTADTIREHLAWKALICATDAYEAWRASLPTRQTTTCFSDEEAIVKQVLFRASVATHAINDVLEFEHGWLMDVPTVRSKCLPFLVFHSHRVQMDSVVFVESLEFYPRQAKDSLQAPLAQNAMNLADIVADEHNRVYRAFSQEQTRHLLHLLQQSAMYLL